VGQFIGLNALSQQTYDGFTLGIQMQSALLIHFVSPSNKTVNFVAFPTKVSFVLCHSATSSNTDSLVKNLVHKFVVHFLQCACFDREHHKLTKRSDTNTYASHSEAETHNVHQQRMQQLQPSVNGE